jgi:hypothetical protein
MSLPKLNKRQWTIAVLFLMTLVAVTFAPPKEDEQLVGARGKKAIHMVEGSEVEVQPRVMQSLYHLDKSRSWVVDKSEDLFPSKVKPLPPAPVLPPPLPPPVPAAPPLPFVYLGQVVENGKLTVFVSKQEKTYIFKGGEVVEGAYRLDKIEPTQLVFTYLPMGVEQAMKIGGKE